MKNPSRRLILQSGAAMLAMPLLARYAQAAEYRIKIGSDTPTSYPMNIRISEAAARVKQRTGGRVDMKLYPNSQLGSDMLNQVHSGSLEFFLCSSQLAVPLVPICALTGLAYAFKDSASAFKAMDGEVGSLLRGQMEKIGLFAIPAAMEGGIRQIISNKPIKSPDDLSGFKIRVPIAPMWVSEFKALGASPTPISINELYTALQTKVVDGAENYLSLLYAMRLYEVEKYISMTKHMWDCYWILGSQRMWQGLPKDLQKITEEELTAAAISQRKDMAKVDIEIPAKMKKAGMVFIEPDLKLFQDKLKSAGYYSEWRKKFGPQAMSILEKYSGPIG
jgi:tripartite ATP-independent transporter DctP family solute receptor